MNVKELRKYMKPTARKAKAVFLREYVEDPDTTTIKYQFKGQKESNLTIPASCWKKMKFEVDEGNTVRISNLGDLKIITNETGWSRLALPETEEDTDD